MQANAQVLPLAEWVKLTSSSEAVRLVFRLLLLLRLI